MSMPKHTTIFVLAVLFTSLAVPALAAGGPTCALASVTPLAPLESAQPLAALGPCTVTRNCNYPPPWSISCTSSGGVCASGPQNNGWVQCDNGPVQYCSPCPQACNIGPDCWDYCESQNPGVGFIASCPNG